MPEKLLRTHQLFVRRTHVCANADSQRFARQVALAAGQEAADHHGNDRVEVGKRRVLRQDAHGVSSSVSVISSVSVSSSSGGCTCRCSGSYAVLLFAVPSLSRRFVLSRLSSTTNVKRSEEHARDSCGGGLGGLIGWGARELNLQPWTLPTIAGRSSTRAPRRERQTRAKMELGRPLSTSELATSGRTEIPIGSARRRLPKTAGGS